MSPCLTLSIIMQGSRVKWRNRGKGVAPSPTPWCSSYRKGSLRVTLDYGRQLYYLLIRLKIFLYIYIYTKRFRTNLPRFHLPDDQDNFAYLSNTPHTREGGIRLFLDWEPGTGAQSKHGWWFQKCLRPRRHSPKKRRLRCQVINLAPQEKLENWGNGPLRLKVLPQELTHIQPDTCWGCRIHRMHLCRGLRPHHQVSQI